MDAQARVNIGTFSRDRTSRVEVKTSDHDFNPETILTSAKIFLPKGMTYRDKYPAIELVCTP